MNKRSIILILISNILILIFFITSLMIKFLLILSFDVLIYKQYKQILKYTSETKSKKKTHLLIKNYYKYENENIFNKNEVNIQNFLISFNLNVLAAITLNVFVTINEIINIVFLIIGLIYLLIFTIFQKIHISNKKLLLSLLKEDTYLKNLNKKQFNKIIKNSNYDAELSNKELTFFYIDLIKQQEKDNDYKIEKFFFYFNKSISFYLLIFFFSFINLWGFLVNV